MKTLTWKEAKAAMTVAKSDRDNMDSVNRTIAIIKSFRKGQK